MERLSLIDIAVEDDLLSSSLSDALIDQISPGPTAMLAKDTCIQSIPADSDEALIKLKTSKQMEKVLELSDSPEQNQTKPGKCNLRKSLAWDSAFFTSEGVLNHEELAIVNNTFKKTTEAHKLPIILEDTRKSSESTSTLDNDSWVLENLEVDLFDNIRASIQKTHGNDERASRLANFSKKSKPCDDVSINVEPSSHNKKKTPGVVSNHNGRHASRVPNNAKLARDGIASSKIISKPPRVLPKLVPPTMPTKAPSVSGNTKTRTVRGRPDNATSQKSDGVSKKINAGSCGVTSKSSQSPKINLNLVNTRADKVHTSREITRMRSNSATDRSSSGPITSKVSLRTSGKKMVSRSRNSSGLSPKSVVSSSSTVSPSSSFDSVASASSSSTIFALKPSADYTEASSSSPSLGGVDNDKLHSPGRRSLHSRDAILRSPESCLPLEPSKGNHLDTRTNSISGANCYKPSGLKMPTPKIGYFDGTKPVICNVNTHQTSQQPNILKFTSGISKTESASKLKLSQIQYTSPTLQNMAMTSEIPKTQSNTLHCTPTKVQLRSIEKDFYAMIFEEAENNNSETRRVPKLCTRMEERDLHTEDILMEGEEAIVSDSSSTINKLSLMVSRMGVQKTDNQNSDYCDLSNFNAEKENTNIAAE